MLLDKFHSNISHILTAHYGYTCPGQSFAAGSNIASHTMVLEPLPFSTKDLLTNMVVNDCLAPELVNTLWKNTNPSNHAIHTHLFHQDGSSVGSLLPAVIMNSSCFIKSKLQRWSWSSQVPIERPTHAPFV